MHGHFMPMYFMRRLHKGVVEGSIAFPNVSLTIPIYFTEGTLHTMIVFFVPNSASASYICVGVVHTSRRARALWILLTGPCGYC